MFDFKKGKYLYSMELGDAGRMPLEIRFLHNPNATEGYVGCAFSSNIYRFFKNAVSSLKYKFDHFTTNLAGSHLEALLLVFTLASS